MKKLSNHSNKNGGVIYTDKTGWLKAVTIAFTKLRYMAKPLAWINHDPKFAFRFISAVIASHEYSKLCEAGFLRFVAYATTKAEAPHVR